MLRRDEHIQRLNDEFAQLQTERDDQREHVEGENQELWKAQNEARLIIQVRNDEIRRLRVRLDRLLDSPPIRTWYSLRRLPFARRIVAKRTADYEAALNQTDNVEHK